MVCVDVGGGGGAAGLKYRSVKVRNHPIERTHSAKYHAAITLAVVILIIPRDTPQLHNHTTTVPAIAQFAHV